MGASLEKEKKSKYPQPHTVCFTDIISFTNAPTGKGKHLQKAMERKVPPGPYLTSLMIMDFVQHVNIQMLAIPLRKALQTRVYAFLRSSGLKRPLPLSQCCW